MGTFGAAFTTGASSGPLYVAVLGNFQTQIFVSTLGTKTNEVGFVVKASNGTTIYTRSNGSTFASTTTFSTFCPLGGCPSTSSYIITITMTDSVGDGWNGNILSIMQNDTFVQSFGETFTYGMLTEPVYVLVQGNRFAQIYVNQLGSGTPEVGFVVKSPSGTTLCQKSVGTAFYSSTLFPRFCVAGGCPTPATLNLTILIYDSYGDGWNGNVWESNKTTLL